MHLDLEVSAYTVQQFNLKRQVYAVVSSFLFSIPAKLRTYPPPSRPAPLIYGQVEEALPHLVEAVSIDPENAKYRHTLGLAKCATGDEAGAREDLLEAVLLDEEDAEDRYQLRVQRESEARKLLEKRSKHQDSDDGARQVLGLCGRGYSA